MPRTPSEFSVSIDKLVHGGQGLGTLEDGRKALVWGVLPGEKVVFISRKRPRDYVEGVVSEVLEPSKDRIQPKDSAYLSTSPWQMMSEQVEDAHKAAILEETFTRAKIDSLPQIITESTSDFYAYRNKMEYSFYGDETGLHLALFNRGTHQKQVVEGSSIANPMIDQVANNVVAILSKHDIRASQLKTIILRCNQAGEVVAALYVKDEQFPDLPDLKTVCKGITIVYSTPKSPASVRTKDLFMFGNVSLSDTIGDTNMQYDVFSFFQVNVPVFNHAVASIGALLGDVSAVDMYSVVGSIGLALQRVETLVEVDAQNVQWAKKNAKNRKNARVIHAASEKALDYISSDRALIVDPPRAGLHQDLIKHISEKLPPKIIYLSCNPSTQARDISILQQQYKLTSIQSFNFFPRTPHIESLVCLVRR